MLPTSRITAACNVFRGWINYIGIKYPQLRGLEMDWVAGLIDCTEVTRTALIPTLMKLKHIERYSISICPLEQSIFDVMNDNGTELQHFEFLVDTNDTMQNTFRSVQTAQSVSTISSLSLSWSVGVNPLLFGQSLADLCHHLKYLTRLEVPYGQYRGDACILLMDIVQNHGAQKSGIWGFQNRDTIVDNLSYNKLSNIHTSRLESIYIANFILESKGSVLKCNCLFSFILQSCPNLKIFDLSTFNGGVGLSDASEIISLDFRENNLLRHIQISLNWCRYFIFHHDLESIGKASMNKLRKKILF